VILINLLPQSLRVSERKKTELPYKQVVVGVFLIFFVVSIYNLFIFIRLREQHRDLEKKWAPLAQSSMQADRLEQELGTSILAEIDFYDSLVDPLLEAAQVMNFVSDLLPKGAWLVRFQFEREMKEMQTILNGLSEPSGKSSKLVEIQNFANALKDEMEKIISPSSGADKLSAIPPLVELPPDDTLPAPAPPPFLAQGRKKIEAAVTTSSEQAREGQPPLVQFIAAFKTTGFGAKKEQE